MIVITPYHSGDADAHTRLMRSLHACDGFRERHTSRPVLCADDGRVVGWDFCARPQGRAATCAQVWAGVCYRLPPNTTFLWLEPDCCITRRTALDEIEAEFARRLAANPELCWMGHDKRDQWYALRFISGCSVYRTTPTLLDAVAKVNLNKPHDVGLGRLMLDTPAAADTPLIRCCWGYDRQAYLERYERSAVNFYRAHPEAAVVHGDKAGEIANHLGLAA